MFTGQNLKLAHELVDTIVFFNSKGWSPATSTNYSVRGEGEDAIIISRSGVDKSRFTVGDLILINGKGEIFPDFKKPGIKSSAETQIHTHLYQLFPEVNCVLHTHSVLGTVLSQVFSKEKELRFEGLEIIKGIEGQTTHATSLSVPIVANSQNMKDIIGESLPFLMGANRPSGLLIAGHGLYTWGPDVATAKRHVETFEFLFECFYTMRRL